MPGTVEGPLAAVDRLDLAVMGTSLGLVPWRITAATVGSVGYYQSLTRIVAGPEIVASKMDGV